MWFFFLFYLAAIKKAIFKRYNINTIYGIIKNSGFSSVAVKSMEVKCE